MDWEQSIEAVRQVAMYKPEFTVDDVSWHLGIEPEPLALNTVMSTAQNMGLIKPTTRLVVGATGRAIRVYTGESSND